MGPLEIVPVSVTCWILSNDEGGRTKLLSYIICLSSVLWSLDDANNDDDGRGVWIDRKKVPPRAQSTKSEVKGMFIGARVVRGLDWSWADQDGNEAFCYETIYSLGWL